MISSGGDRHWAPAADGIREVLARTLPAVVVRSLTELGRGTDHVAHLVNGELIVRRVIARDTVVRRGTTRREADLLTLVAGVSTLPVPELVAVDADAGVTVYRRVPGQPLLGRTVPEPDRFAEPLGRFLDALHRTPADRLAGVVERDTYPLSAYRDEAAQHYRAVANHIPASGRRLVEDFLARTPPPEPATLVFCHNDLGAEHLLADAEGTALTGVIDWSDAALTDPARDVGRLYRDFGPRFVGRVLQRYHRAWSDADHDRAVFTARCALLEDLLHGLESGDDRYSSAALANLARTFGLAADR
jgi:aminoglycoside phosphotransferase (APT) family kinase protein